MSSGSASLLGARGPGGATLAAYRRAHDPGRGFTVQRRPAPASSPGTLLRLLDGAQDQVRPRGVQGLLVGGLEEAGERVAVQA